MTKKDNGPKKPTDQSFGDFQPTKTDNKPQNTNKKPKNKQKAENNQQNRNAGADIKIQNTILSADKNSQTAATNKKPQNQQKAENNQRPNQKVVHSKPKQNSLARTKGKEQTPLRIAFLGGLNEIGKNMILYEYNDEMFIADCGLAFPDDELLGVDLVIPDFTYVERNKEKIKGIVITHGHEDHIGALPYLLKQLKVPLYGTRLTLGLVSGKLKEHGLAGKVQMHTVNPGETVWFSEMSVEFIRVNHSIPDAVGFAVHTPAGVVIMTGDFKIDATPIVGEMIDIARFAELGREGVLALMSDSTNAERPGYTMSERKVGDSFDLLFKRAEKHRIIIATFASNIHRVQQIIDYAHKYDRKVAVSGRSMINVIGVAIELGYLTVPPNVIVDLDLINRYPKEKMVLITTGSQGEPMSALSRMAVSDHRKVEVGPQDFIIISATPIPGNEKTVGKVVDELMKRGCEVVYEKMYEVHVSGHACQEELKLMLGLVKPKYFIPVHGEQKHLRKHAQLALSMGMEHKNVFIGEVGSLIELSGKEMKALTNVPAGKVLVDGSGVGDVGSIVLRDRKHLAQDGLIVVVASINADDGFIVSGPDIVSRGFVYVRESESLMDDCRTLAKNIIDECAGLSVREWGTIKNRIKDDMARLVYEKTKRRPMILPVIMEI